MAEDPRERGADSMSDPEEQQTAYAIVGLNQYHEDGFEIICVFEDVSHAEDYKDSGEPAKDAEYGWERYAIKEVPYVPE